jgi:two-component system chemotaxis response regulator CheB
MRRIIGGLPANFPAPICIVIHISAESPGLLPSILTAAGRLRAEHASQGELVQPGCIYIAPPDRHFLLGPEGQVVLGAGPKENRFRPAIDPLFRSAARHYGAKTVGVLVSGGLDDGVAGLADIKAAGGVTIVQLPEEAPVRSMPEAALRAVAIDHCLPAEQITGVLLGLVRQATAPASSKPIQREFEMENGIAAGDDPQDMDLNEISELSRLTCPDCAGVLRRIKRPPLRYRCHTGHAYTAETLADAMRKRTDDAVWSALQRHAEEEDFLRELSYVREDQGDSDEAAKLKADADRTAAIARRLRTILETEPSGGQPQGA